MIHGNIIQSGHSNNSMFAATDFVHHHNPTVVPITLRNVLLQMGLELNTPDLNKGRKVDFELHIEGRPLAPSPMPRFLIAMENPYINFLNHQRDYLMQFRRVFTFNQRLFGLPNVTPTLIPHGMQRHEFRPFKARDLLSCLINANKGFSQRLDTDLYGERLRVIRWYERNAPELFGLYGIGWNRPERGPGPVRWIRHEINGMRVDYMGYRPFPSWRGEIKNKSEILGRCKFSYCYENVRDLPNYVTEKIMDSLLSGCVPVYWGADNVTDLIPEECFIDRREFSDTAKVHRYLLSMKEAQYGRYQEAIQNYLDSKLAQQFSAEHFSYVVGSGIVNEMNRDQTNCNLAKSKSNAGDQVVCS